MPDFWTSVKGLLDLFGIYSIHIAESTREALEIIKNNDKRFHTCLLDRGMNDVESNEFYLIEKFGKIIPFIIMTARRDPNESFLYGRRGAKAFVEKGVKGFGYQLVSNINKNAMQNILCPKYNEGQQDLFCKCLETLINTKPLRVSEWAREMNILPRQIQREWEEHVGVNPLHSLYVFHLYFSLFIKIENYLQKVQPQEQFSLSDTMETLLKSNDYNRIFDYCSLHWSKILIYITTHQMKHAMSLQY
jgi:hypothetical protein